MIPRIRVATPEDSIERALVGLVNEAFTPSEEGIIVPNKHDGLVRRLTVADATGHIEKGELLILEGSTSEENCKPQTTILLGCCMVRKLDDNVGEWGCYAVHRSHQGRGYGKRLLQAAEAYLTDIFHCTEIRIELLIPAAPAVCNKHKLRMKNMYQTVCGYQPCPEEHVHYKAGSEFVKHNFFANDATLLVYRKRPTTWIRPGNLASDEPFIDELATMVNDAYREGEKGILLDTPTQPLCRLSRGIARKRIENFFNLWKGAHKSTERKVIGCVKVDSSDGSIGEWGCLAVASEYQGLGYASRLVRVAEDFLTRQCVAWKIQLVHPVHWKHDHKERLRLWYQNGLRYIPDPDGAMHFKQGDRIGSFVFATDAAFTDFLSSEIAKQRRQYLI